MVRNADALAPTEPNVEITANPMGPQLHAPAATPIIEPKIPPPIFCLDFLSMFIRNMFIGSTNADNTEIITIRVNPISVPDGIWLTRYGSKKMYSDKINNPINMNVKIIIAKMVYLGFENTNLTVDTIQIIESMICLKTENGCAPLIFCCPSGPTIMNPGVPRISWSLACCVLY